MELIGKYFVCTAGAASVEFRRKGGFCLQVGVREDMIYFENEQKRNSSAMAWPWPRRIKGFFMITSGLRQTIENCARAFDVQAVWLFGSAAQDDTQARDIDLAVEGLPADKFFDFYARLFFELPKPVDLVDLSQEPPIAGIVREKGICIYERRN